jgi:predicted nucleic acid-binding protein
MLLISDANILIDFECGGAVEVLFRFGRVIGVPDVLFEQELRARHTHLLALGLRSMVVEPAAVARAVALARVYRRPSRIDLLALALAEFQRCPLITGDRHLRAAAEAEQVEVHGTLWVMAQVVAAGSATPAHARVAYAAMRDQGRRLPWALVNEQLLALGVEALSAE